jgi:chromosome segregation ATPase
MSGGAFRDAGSAAFERVAILEQENADLEAELKKLRDELDALRAEDGQREERPREISRLQVQLAAERADLKEALTELKPLSVKLERAERAYHEAKDDRRLAVEEASTARGQLKIANEDLATAREQIRELRIALKNAQDDTSSRVHVETRVPENLDAYMQRIQQERDDLREEVRMLKEAASKSPRARSSLLDALFGRR